MGEENGKGKNDKKWENFQLVLSQTICWWGGRGAEKRLGLCERYSAVRKYHCIIKFVSSTNPNIALYQLLWRETSLPQPKPTHTCTRCSHTGTTLLQLWLFVSLGWQQLSKRWVLVGFFNLVWFIFWGRGREGGHWRSNLKIGENQR